MIRTNSLELGHGLVVLPVKLGPSREVVLRRRISKLALQLDDFLLELLDPLCRARRRRRQLVIEYP
jgi:hypothetical protein